MHGCYDSWRERRYPEVINVETGKVVGRGQFAGQEPSWSPDGNWIAWTETSQLDGFGTPCVRISTADMKGSYRLTGCNTGDYQTGRWPVWSPDGSRVAWLRGFPTTKMAILTSSAKPGSPRTLIARGYMPIYDWR